MIASYLIIGDSQIAVHIEKCDRLRITVDFAALLMTRPGGAHSNISMKVRNTNRIAFFVSNAYAIICRKYIKHY